MKKVLSIVLALVMVMSLGITAFADNTSTEETGSITITNATLGESYYVYKIFSATIAEDNSTVSYTIEEGNPFYSVLFDNDGNPTTANKFFVLNPLTGGITKAEGVNDSELVKFLQDGIEEFDHPDHKNATASKIETDTTTIQFDNLPYGYYVIKSSLGATVTIDSNTPDVSVIDKNQVPGTEFDKTVQTGVDSKGNPVYGNSNSAMLGETFKYKIEFFATNYDGEKLIKYYQVNDQKGDAIWAEFNSFTVTVGDETLKRGYYLCRGDESVLNTDGWKYLGDWSDIPEAERSINDADWYLVHVDRDQFRITIPWLEGHTLTTTPAGNNTNTYALDFPENAASRYPSPAKVVITYNAALESNATIGGTATNMYNEATASWTSQYESGSSITDKVETKTYGLGVLKDDSADGKNLPGAEFRIYSNEACTTPVFVIPTNIEGVYIVDSKSFPPLSGSKMETSRVTYKDYLADYLGSDYETTGKQDNLLVTPVNGKAIVLGLDEGTYYLQETKAPDGYNALSAAVKFEVNAETAKLFPVFADATGAVADVQTASGNYAQKDFHVTNTVVHNSQGVELPSTGGTGTMMLITIGSMIAMAFAVLLITHKKMTVYHD